MIKFLKKSHGNVIGLEAVGEITEKDIAEWEAKINKAIKKYGTVNWLFVLKTTKFESLKSMYSDMKWLLKNYVHFGKMAIVGDKKWQKLMVKADRLAYGEKYFDISQLDEAWDYIES